MFPWPSLSAWWIERNAAKKIKIEKYNDITNEEIKNLEKAIEEDYFYFNLDSIELYENNIINDKQYDLEKFTVYIDDNLYNNIPLNEINNIKKLIKDIKNIKVKDINFDFINNKILLDTYINFSAFCSK